jgi:hypothetical protein
VGSGTSVLVVEGLMYEGTLEYLDFVLQSRVWCEGG